MIMRTPAPKARASVKQWLRYTAAVSACTAWLTACDGDRHATPAPAQPTAPVNSIPTSIKTPDQAAVINVKLSLPAGVPQTVDTLSLNDSIGAVSAGSTGTFALPIFSGGPQYADVRDADGTIIALGFLSTGMTTIDATSTAKVLVYFAGGFFDLPLPHRVDIVDQIASVSGFADVVTAVSKAMVAGGVGSKNGGPIVTTALQTFIAALYAPSNKTPTALVAQHLQRHIKEVLVQPSTEQSGITAINDFPNGVHFMNKYRRLATAYIDEVSFTDAQGMVQPKSVIDFVAPVQIPNTSGVSTVTSTAVDAARVLAGGSGDYTPVTTSTVPLPLESGSTKTTYKITVVGPGVHAGTVQLTTEQLAQQTKLVLQTLVQSYVVPLTCSVLVPLTSSQIDDFFRYDGGNSAVSDLIYTLGVAAPTTYDQVDQGNISDAVTTTFNAFAQSNVLQAKLLQVVIDAIGYTKGAAAANEALGHAQRLLTYLNIASGILVTYDVGVLTTQLGLSNKADAFTVDVIAPKVKLTPRASIIAVTETQTFTAIVPSATDSGQTVVYKWSDTAANGHMTDGLAGHVDTFDSSRNSVTYTPNATGSGDDTITVQAYLVNNQDRILIGQAVSTVTVQNVGVPIGLSPQNPQIERGTLQNFTVKSSGADFPAGTKYHWVLSAGFDLFGQPRDLGGSGGGTIGVNIAVPASSAAATGTKKTVDTTSPSITFAANPFGPEAVGTSFRWQSILQLDVTVTDAAGNSLQTATTPIQTQMPRGIMLP